LIGLSTAITLYTYNGGRSVIFFFIIFWAVTITIHRFKFKIIKHWIASSAVAFIVSIPIFNYALNNWQTWNGRALALQTQPDQVLSNLKNSLNFYNLNARGNDFFTDFPVLEGPIKYLWIIGIFYCLIKFKKYWPSPLLFFTLLLPSVFTVPSFHRAVGTLPLVYFFGILFLFKLFHSTKKIYKSYVAISIIVILSLLQIYISFKKLYIDQQPFLWGFYPETTVVGNYLKTLPHAPMAVYASNWPVDALTFLALKDYSSVKPPFYNYQSYNTPSRDGLPEIIQDLQNSRLPSNTIFIVENNKISKFKQQLFLSGYQPQTVSTITNSANQPIAQTFKLTPSTTIETTLPNF
jgi:hypothetical protein